MKNPNMKLAEALRGIPANLKVQRSVGPCCERLVLDLLTLTHTTHFQVIISGTPIQNNLLEMHALFDYCCPGLLGTRRMFAR